MEREVSKKNCKIVPTVKVVKYSVTVSLYDVALQGSSERVVIYTFSLGRRVVYLSVGVRLPRRKFLITDPASY